MIGRIFLIFAALTYISQAAETKLIQGFPEHFKEIQQIYKHISEQTSDPKDVNEEVNQIVNNLKNEINKIENDVVQFLNNLDEMVKRVLKNMDLDKFVQDMEAKIEDILKKAEIEASSVQNCIDIEQDQVTKLVTDTSINIKKCVSKVDDSTRIIKDNRLEIENKAENLLENFNNDIEQCIGNEICIQKVLEATKDKASNTITEIEDFVMKTNNEINQLEFDFKKCMVALEMDVWDKKRLIIEEFKKCIVQ